MVRLLDIVGNSIKPILRVWEALGVCSACVLCVWECLGAGGKLYMYFKCLVDLCAYDLHVFYARGGSDVARF